MRRLSAEENSCKRNQWRVGVAALGLPLSISTIRGTAATVPFNFTVAAQL
jgi:hypothetical protein